MKGDRFIEENNTTTFPQDFSSTRDRCTQIHEFCFIICSFFFPLGPFSEVAIRGKEQGLHQ